jgi:hypothetical protein
VVDDTVIDDVLLGRRMPVDDEMTVFGMPTSSAI